MATQKRISSSKIKLIESTSAGSRVEEEPTSVQVGERRPLESHTVRFIHTDDGVQIQFLPQRRKNWKGFERTSLVSGSLFVLVKLYAFM